MTTYGKIYFATQRLDQVCLHVPSDSCSFITFTALAFIRGLLENVGAEINPIRIIRRIKNGLEIPGLKGALIKILHDFNIQVFAREGLNPGMHTFTLQNGFDGGQVALTLLDYIIYS